MLDSNDEVKMITEVKTILILAYEKFVEVLSGI